MTARSWVRRLFARTPRTVRKAPARFRPRIEAIEDRVVPSGDYYVNTLLDDNTAWRLGADGAWTRLAPKKGDRAQPAQQALMRSARRRRPSSHRLRKR